MWKRLAFLCFSTLLFTISAHAEEKQDGFYEDRRHGYYWYEDEKAIEKEKPALPTYTYQELWTMDPDTFQKHLSAVTKRAVQAPTEENALEFLKLKDIATQKSMAFASVMTLVSQQHPEYASDTASPVTAPGKRAQLQARESEIKTTIFREKENFALVMFVRPGCGYCDEQEGIISHFETQYNWQIRTVNIEEKPALAAKFNVQITPTLIMVHKEGEHMIISYGVISMSDIEKRIYRSIRLMKGDIDESQWLMYDYQKRMGDDPLKNVHGENENQ